MIMMVYIYARGAFLALPLTSGEEPLSTTTLAKKIETTAPHVALARDLYVSSMHAPIIICLACVPVSIFLARVV